MAQRFARAVLALLCAVAVVYGTAMFPAAFDVAIGPDSPGGSAAPSTAVGAVDDGPTDTASGTDSDTSTDTTSDDAATATESSTATATPSPTESGAAASADDRSGIGFATLMLGFAGVVVFLTLGLVATVAGGTRPLGQGGPLPGLLSRLPIPAVPLRRIPQVTTLLIVSAGGGLARFVDDVSTVAGAAVRGLSAGVGPIASLLGRAFVGLPAAIGAIVAAPARSLGSAGGLLGNLGSLAFVRGGVSRADDGVGRPATDVRTAADAEPATEDDAEPVASVLAAWAAMTDLVPVRNPESATAGEYARKAVDAGFPATPVERLTALFREVRYGGRPDSGDRVAAARRALDALTGGEE